MPSIPQSLLWISLVVLWLFVLVPMLISKRDTVRRTSDVALATRVLNDDRGSRLLRRRRPAAGHHSDPHWQPSEDGSDDDLDDADTTPKRSIVLAAAVVVTESEYLDVDIVEEDSGALPVGVSAATETVQEPELQLDFGTLGDPESADGSEDTDEMAVVDDVDESEDTDDTDEIELDDEFDDEFDDDGSGHEYEYVDDTTGLEPPSEDPLPLSLSQARRQRSESKTAAAVSARKFKFRKRMLMAMSVLLVAAGVAAYVVSPAFWWVAGSLGVVTLLYLGYLRRQTRIEQQVRRRRSQRMMRSRLGVENTLDPEFDVVPSRLRRPGAVVLEIDDEDPVFEHLDYAPVAHDYHLPRAAGQ